MQPFDQSENAYTATAQTVVFSAGNTYDPAKLDNPLREKVNYALVFANIHHYKSLLGCL